MSAQMRPEESFVCDRSQDPDEADPEFEALLAYLKHNRGCDLTSYKRAALVRRFAYRMQRLNIQTYPRYLQYLDCHLDECGVLFDEVLINFTSFFRDRDAWDYLALEVIPKLIASKQPHESIRIWSAGCAGGQEIYSLLILLAEALGLEACLERVQGFASDADESALWQARQATYSSKELIGMPPELLKKYFKQTEKGYVFDSELRRNVIFSHHDLTQDPPISKIDLLACRNVLIYFTPDAQTAILSRFHFALSDTGFLFLGKAEMVMLQKQVFVPIDAKHRVYVKASKLELDDYLALSPKFQKQTSNELPIQNYFWEAAFETSSSAHLAIDTNGCLLHANEQARLLFGLTFDDWRRPFRELKPAKLVSPNTVMQALHARQCLTMLNTVKWTTQQGTKYFDIHISRVLTTKNHLLGATLTFIETDNHQQLTADLESARLELAEVSKTLETTKSELSLAYRELDSTLKEVEVLHQEMRFIRQDVNCN